eukprot:10634528-Alexandrium_andersonii.AAC.1
MIATSSQEAPSKTSRGSSCSFQHGNTVESPSRGPQVDGGTDEDAFADELTAALPLRLKARPAESNGSK